jgi:hypothetical protein
MKKMITLLSITLLALASCSKEDSKSTPTTTPETIILLKKVISTRNDGSINNRIFTYDGNKLLGSKYELGKSVLIYKGDLITKESDYDYNGTLTYEVVYTYENNKLKSTFETKNSVDLITGAITSTYKTKRAYKENSDGTIIMVENYKIDTTTGLETKQNNISVKTFSNGNLITEVITNTNKLTDNGGNITTNVNIYTITYEYDTKNYFLKNVLGLDKLYNIASTNNVIKSTTLFENSINGEAQPTKPASVTNYEYQYNTSGYPIEQKEISTVNSVVQTKITQYFYE